MNKSVLYIIVLLFSLIFLHSFVFASEVSAQELREVWTEQFGAESGSSDRAFDVSYDGSVFVAGSTDGQFSGEPSSGGIDAFVRKYDANGNEVWTRQFGTNLGTDGYVEIRGVFAYGTDVYVVGDTYGDLPGQTNPEGWWDLNWADAFVRKYDTNGSEMWTKQFGPDSGVEDMEAYANGVFADATGVYLVGEVYGDMPGQIGSGAWDAFIRKYDTSGNELWIRQFGTDSFETAYGVSGDGSVVYIVGETYGVFVGQTPSGGGDAYLRKYDTSGNEIWTEQFGTSSNERADGVSTDVSGVYVTGTTWGVFPGFTGQGKDVFVRKYDDSGVDLWTQQFGTDLGDEAAGISVDVMGVYMAGSVGGTLPGQTSSGSTDAFIRKLDTNGNTVWTDQFGSDKYDVSSGISANVLGVFIAGITNGELPGQKNSGGWDVFVRKYRQDSDGDGIFDEVDTEFTVYSNDFSDGKTYGSISKRGLQDIKIMDEVEPDGVLIVNELTLQAEPARIVACGGAIKMNFDDVQDRAILTCGSASIDVVNGEIEIVFVAESGATAEATLAAGYSLTFEPVSAQITASSINPDKPPNPGPIVITIGGSEIELEPGETGTVPAPNRPPTANAGGPYLVTVGSTITLDGTGSDPDEDGLIFSWDVDGGILDPIEDPIYTAGNEAGIFTATLTVTDPEGSSASSTALIVVYDPEGGFVTGGGWINSPVGAYTLDPSLTGKASFGFVSKYKKGTLTPSGQTQFLFQIADLNFHSDSYEWLVVTGHKAMFKGTGTINGEGNYGFMLSAIDGDLNSSTDVDLFRIKIWDKDNGDAIVYDNQMNGDENSDPTTAIGGGSIVIHKVKTK